MCCRLPFPNPALPDEAEQSVHISMPIPLRAAAPDAAPQVDPTALKRFKKGDSTPHVGSSSTCDVSARFVASLRMAAPDPPDWGWALTPTPGLLSNSDILCLHACTM